jgi:hypothetical protein
LPPKSARIALAIPVRASARADAMMSPHRLHCTHGVVFYQDEALLSGGVARHVAAALRAGDPALVLARPGLLREVTIELHRQHVQGVPFGPDRGTLVALEAEETLARICVAGRPDARRFDEVIGTAVRNLAAAGRRVAAYGELVGVLCARGQYKEALRLEDMWNELLASVHASLLCGYAQALFAAPETRGFADAIRAAHTEVHEDLAALAAA